MKKLRHVVWIIFLYPFLIQAQTKPAPFKVGSNTSFIKRLANSAIPKPGSTTLNSVTIQLSPTESVIIDLHSAKASDDGKTYAGKVRNEQSRFNLAQTGKLTEGSVIFDGKAKGFKLYADENDNLYSKEVSVDELLCIGMEKQLYSNPNETTVVLPAGQNIYDLQSYPLAKAVVLLDFDGQYVPAGPWGDAIDAEASRLSKDEMFEAWQIVSEDYRPFNINITTNESVFLNAPSTQRKRVIFTPNDKALPGSGGVAFIGSFVYGDEYPCWVFNAGGKIAGESASHEVGHTLELFHDGRQQGDVYEEYYWGNSIWAPIMGVGFYKHVVQWSKGEYQYASNTEDDLAIIASERNGFGYRTDDVGNSTSSAKPFVVGNNGEVIATFNNGNIESNTDIDVYAFTTAGGRSNLTIIPAVHSNLHAKVEIRDQSNNIIQSFKEDSIEVTKINLNLNAGNYYLFISGEGHGDPSTEGYSDYGSLGFYSIAGSIPVQNNYRNPENPSNIANGLDYKYFEGEWSYIPNFAGLTPIKSGVESNFSLASRARNDNFGYSFSGFIDIPNDGQYTFYTNSDDGSKLFIGSTLVVDNDGLHSNREKSGTIGLKAGKHAIKVEFFERGGEEVLGVKFSGPNISKRDISSSQLYRIQTPVYRDPENPSNIVNGVDYKYYEGYEWTVIPNFGLLVSNSEGSSDNFSLNSRKRDDNFGYTFNGFVEVPTDGCYTFYTNSDDGSKLYIGSSLVVRNDSLHPARETSGKINLKAGKHAIKVEFFERTGGQVLDVKYEGPGISKQVIPSNKLFRINTPTLRDPENPQSLSEGLSYRYFEGTGWTSVQDLTALTPIKSGVSSNFSISSRNRNDDFGFEYLGYVNIESSGVYNFFTNSDDGSKLYIGQTLVVDNDGLHGDAQRSGSIGLKPGKHAIKVVFFERTGQEVLEVRYEGPGVSKQVIPDTRLFRTVSGAIASVSDSLEFYPNPTKQFINIEMATGAIISKVVIFDMFGNKDMEVNVDKDSLKLDVSGLQSGFYTVQIVTSDQVFVRRLQIE